jgi:hypothetical protein
MSAMTGHRKTVTAHNRRSAHEQDRHTSMTQERRRTKPTSRRPDQPSKRFTVNATNDKSAKQAMHIWQTAMKRKVAF